MHGSLSAWEWQIVTRVSWRNPMGNGDIQEPIIGSLFPPETDMKSEIKALGNLFIDLIKRANNTKLDTNNKRLYRSLEMNERIGDLIDTMIRRLEKIVDSNIAYSSPLISLDHSEIHNMESVGFFQFAKEIVYTLVLSGNPVLKQEYATTPLIVEWKTLVNIHASPDIIFTIQKTLQGIINIFRSEYIKLETKDQNNALKIENQELQTQVFIDGLTNVPNRRSLSAFQNNLNSNQLQTTSVYAMILDIDHFKLINDKYGHDAWDMVLRAVAQKWKQICDESSSHFARYWWEEFAVVSLGTQQQAEILARKLQQSIKALILTMTDGTIMPQITVSIGMVMVSSSNLDVFDTLKKADIALYNAKDNGRDCIITYDPSREDNRIKPKITVAPLLDTRQRNR